MPIRKIINSLLHGAGFGRDPLKNRQPTKEKEDQ